MIEFNLLIEYTNEIMVLTTLGKGARVPTMWFTGVMGTIGGFLVAYQQSAYRLRGYFPNDREVQKYSISNTPKEEEH